MAITGFNTVAIVGRPNVGKSALFNRLARRKIAIVHNQPGVTRDRLTALCRADEKTFTLVDTGGIGSSIDADFSEQIHAAVDVAIETADVIVFLVDAQAGLTAVDEELGRKLRRTSKPILLAINKIDLPQHEPLSDEFARLGFSDVVLVSAEHRRGIAELLEKIAAALPDAVPARAENGGAIATAVVGRPNVGKSSLVNAIIRDDRTLVSEISGTTRDAIDIPCVRDDQRYILIDTAGIRPRGKHRSSVEVFSVMRAERSIRRADLCVLVIDVTDGVTAQDKKIAGLIQKEQKPCIVAANKWDIMFREAGSRKSIVRVRQELFFIDYAPIILLSAKTGRNMARLFQETDAVRKAATRKLGTGELNRVIRSAVDAHPPPSRGGKRLKILYVTQVEPDRPRAIPLPTFVFFVNDPALLTDPYRKYLESQIRSCEPFAGLPLDLKLRGRERRSTSR